MGQFIRVSVLVLFVLSGATALACGYPGVPDFIVPDGSQSSKDEMIASQGEVKIYVAKVEKYLQCLDQRIAAQPDEKITQQQRDLYNSRYNAAVESMELLAEQFNAALRSYKDAQ